MRPIPLKLLIHEATLNNIVTDDYQNEQDQLATALYRVRFEPETRLVKNAGGVDVQCTALMFFDMINSWPVGATFDVGKQSIVWDGRRYHIEDVQRLYDENKLHHLEVYLSDG